LTLLKVFFRIHWAVVRYDTIRHDRRV